jgi:hypothetical protein
MPTPWVQKVPLGIGSLMSVRPRKLEVWSEDDTLQIEYLRTGDLVLVVSDDSMRGDSEGTYVKVLTPRGKVGWIYRFSAKEIT